MNTERKIELLVSIVSLAIGLIVAVFFSNYFCGVIIGIVIAIGGIVSSVLLEVYFRIQHNIDSRFDWTKKSLTSSIETLKSMKEDIKKEFSSLKILQENNIKEIHSIKETLAINDKEVSVLKKLHEGNTKELSLIKNALVDNKKDFVVLKSFQEKSVKEFDILNQSTNTIGNQIKTLEYAVKESGGINLNNERGIIDIKSVQSDILKFVITEKIKNELSKKEDITVLIGVRNRFDYRLVNALKSVRTQNYPARLIKIIVVDYGSDQNLISKCKTICKEYKAEYLRVEGVKEWNRSKCLNIGLSKVNTKYVLISDVDVVFKNNYLSEAVKAIKNNFYRIAYSPMNWTNKDVVGEKTDASKNFDILVGQSKKAAYYSYAHHDIQFRDGMSIIFALSDLIKIFGGFDEEFKLWGCEDTDFIARNVIAGVDIFSLDKTTAHLHQWHEQYEGVRDETHFDDQRKKNRQHMNESKHVLGNNI